MATIRPFMAIRPAEAYAKDVAALPYDVMNSEEAREMVQESPGPSCMLTRQRWTCRRILTFTALRFTQRQRKTSKT